MPYEAENFDKASSGAITDNYAYEYDVAHLQNAFILPYSSGYNSPTTTNMNNIKRAIMDYGAVAISYYDDDDYHNSKYGSYYYPSPDGSNHAVTIVGWNDNYSRTYFSNKAWPKSNGAWLVKNSWGTNWSDGTDGDANATNSGKEGYFWLSYYDKSLIEGDEVYVFDFEPAGNYQYNYQYDGSCDVESISVSKNDTVSAIYTVTDAAVQKIDAIGLGLYSTNVSGTISIYTGSAMENPTNGNLAIDSQRFSTKYQGYYTFTFEDGPVVNRG
ncbi:MAG: C1 family peptidase, partial [Bacillota bacterium]|nr:C1 family peptidase [Bacillota bacterium]